LRDEADNFLHLLVKSENPFKSEKPLNLTRTNVKLPYWRLPGNGSGVNWCCLRYVP